MPALLSGPICIRFCPGAPKRQKDEAHALQQLARRIRTFPEGKYAPSPPPNVLGKLTDALIVTASDIVISVAQEEPALSGNSMFRLLAWTVADARGAQTAIEKPLALTVGKRLQVQATRVRNDAAPYCKPIMERASREREKLRDGPMTSGDGEAALEAALAAIRAKELSELQQAKEKEIYTGFDELESLLTEEQRWDGASIEQRVAWSLVDARAAELAADVPAPAVPASSTGPPADFDPEVAMKAHFAECGIYFPWVLSQDVEPEDTSIPLDLLTQLGDEASQALSDISSQVGFVGEQWWWSALPAFARKLVEDRNSHAAELQDMRDEVHRQRALAREFAQLSDEAEEAAEELRIQLREARAREAALWEVIERGRQS